MNSTSSYHVPVLADSVVQMLCKKRDGVVVDGTLGGGGHFDVLGKALGVGATLIGIDRDPDAIAFNRDREHTTDARVIIVQGVFSEVSTMIKQHNIAGLDGILLDLGVSSFQIDSAQRGFSYMQECDLDMRMNPGAGVTARELLANLSSEALADVLEKYGEVRNASRMARAIKEYPVAIATSGDLRDCLKNEYKVEVRYKVLAKLFMALRIAVNDELKELQEVLTSATALLNQSGRIAVITYHSLEDRIVKEFFKQQEAHCICPRAALMCTCGTPGVLKRVTHKPIMASDEEVAVNPRSRSARLRVAEKERV